jgi:hypothetical protein
MRGWLNYFKTASIQGKLNTLDGWVRNRLRYCIWHHWKRPRRRAKNLIRLGVDPLMAWQWGHSRMGGWAVSCSPILGTTITLDRLKIRGYISFLEYYLVKRCRCLNRPVRDPYAGWCERCTGGLLAHRPPTRLPAGFFINYCSLLSYFYELQLRQMFFYSVVLYQFYNLLVRTLSLAQVGIQIGQNQIQKSC